MMNKAVFYGTEQYSVEQSCLVMLEKAVLFGTSVSCGIECLIGGQSSVRLSSLIWDRAVLCKKEESYVRQESYMEKSGLLCPSPVL